MIEKLPEAGEWHLIVDKINEIIEAVNKLEEHYHPYEESATGPPATL